MKNPGHVILALAGLCLLVALVAFFLPTAGGLALSYLTILLAMAVGILCIGAALGMFSHDK
ncbi:MAG: hypothetical protein IJL08_01520 [Oscillospiraceae bacterium]|jgi:uncharacterized membrane protein HdeD (DUF308 family)|nr:hypothetical protein [Oscillospiraceae bacterium]